MGLVEGCHPPRLVSVTWSGAYAIRRHDGEAAKTMTRYTRLASSDRTALLSFLNSLTVSAERQKPVASPLKRGAGG
jgi:hypothetical protein